MPYSREAVCLGLLNFLHRTLFCAISAFTNNARDFCQSIPVQKGTTVAAHSLQKRIVPKQREKLFSQDFSVNRFREPAVDLDLLVKYFSSPALSMDRAFIT